jgi:hypothetical protein
MTFKIPALQLERACQATRLLKAIEMNAIDIYRRAIKRTFADLYGVAPDEVDVTWSKDGDNITVRCANKTFTRISKDGVTVALEIELEDKFENMGAQMVREVASKTSDQAGGSEAWH